MAEFKDIFLELRKSRNYTQEQAAKLIGCSNSTIAMWESGKRTPTREKYEAIADLFNVDIDYLYGKTPVKRRILFDEFGTKYTSTTPLRIPVLGRVAAGVPINMVEDVVDWEELPADMARHGEYFGLVIHGDSMEPKMSEGDVIIVRQQADIESGQIGIITVNGNDATCKRIMKYADGIMLLSTNPKYPPMQYTSKEMKDLPIRILGKVVELRAKFE